MTDAQTDQPVDEITGEPEAAPAEAATNGEASGEGKGKRVPPPEGFTTPVAVAKLLGPTDDQGNVIVDSEGKAPGIRPQIVYGYIRNSKTFPKHEHPTTGSPIVKVDEVLAWWKDKELRKREREAKKAAAATEAPAAEAAPEEPTDLQ